MAPRPNSRRVPWLRLPGWPVNGYCYWLIALLGGGVKTVFAMATS